VIGNVRRECLDHLIIINSAAPKKLSSSEGGVLAMDRELRSLQKLTGKLFLIDGNFQVGSTT
jgi:hypothetical protein